MHHTQIVQDARIETMDAERLRLFSSLLEFTQDFYYLRTGRKFELSQPAGRESHYLTICRELINVIKGDTTKLLINVPPRFGKTELIIHFAAWALAQFPDSNFLYVSYSLGLAKKQTKTIRQIVDMATYKNIFGVTLSEDTSAQGNFETNYGGTVYAAGSDGEITGRGAGIKGAKRFGGAILIDDIHKPSEVTSDTMRANIIDWYDNTLLSRRNQPEQIDGEARETPIIFIGQRLHEDDLAAKLIDSGEWKMIVLPALDVHCNALHPGMLSRERLLQMRESMPYVFASQYQQDPQPAGGGIFKPEWFRLFDVNDHDAPEILATFITCDTAETAKDWNDASVFSFWGLHRLKQDDIELDEYGLVWLDCKELRIEPKDLKSAFMDFYRGCMQYPVKPALVGIERKSTGVTLASTLSEYQGLKVFDIERTSASGNKVQRYLDIQDIVATKHISIPRHAKHVDMCLEHMRKITANNTHRHDDIADTLYDAVKLALLDKIVVARSVRSSNKHMARKVMSQFNAVQRIKDRLYGGRSQTLQ